MRTTLDIDDDVLHAAKELARIEEKTAGRVLSKLARKGLTQGSAAGFEEVHADFVVKGGWHQLPNRGRCRHEGAGRLADRGG